MVFAYKKQLFELANHHPVVPSINLHLGRVASSINMRECMNGGGMNMDQQTYLRLKEKNVDTRLLNELRDQGVEVRTRGHVKGIGLRVSH